MGRYFMIWANIKLHNKNYKNFIVKMNYISKYIKLNNYKINLSNTSKE